MRLNGELLSCREEEEEEMDSLNCSVGGVGFPQSQNLVVGYALTSKKKKSFLQPKLLGLARYIMNPMPKFQCFCSIHFCHYMLVFYLQAFSTFVSLLSHFLIWVAKFFGPVLLFHLFVLFYGKKRWLVQWWWWGWGI